MDVHEQREHEKESGSVNESGKNSIIIDCFERRRTAD